MARNEPEAVSFIQRVASQRNAVCKADHHAGTCRGAVGLAQEAARVLAGLGEELPADYGSTSAFDEPCPVCGGGEYVVGQVWLKKWVHAQCLDELRKGRAGGEQVGIKFLEWLLAEARSERDQAIRQHRALIAEPDRASAGGT